MFLLLITSSKLSMLRGLCKLLFSV